MRSTPCANESISVGASKLGGLPDLPPQITWPRWKTDYLTFVAQVNLAELPASDSLPIAGMSPSFVTANNQPGVLPRTIRKDCASGIFQNHRSSFAPLNPDLPCFLAHGFLSNRFCRSLVPLQRRSGTS